MTPGASHRGNINIMDNHGLTFSQDTFLCIFKDGQLAAIERQNGHLERWTTEPATRAKSLEIFGADKVTNFITV